MKVATLDEVCYLNMGQSPDSSTYNEVGDGLPFYQGNADFGEKHPQCRVWCSEPTKIAEKEDILISVRAPIGALNEANERCCIGRGLAAIRPKEKINKDFLYYFLQSKKSYLISKGTGSTFKAISKNVLRELSIPVPTLHEQEKRARILNTLWRVIYTRRAQLAKLDELVKCRFVELFGDSESESIKWHKVPLYSLCSSIVRGPFGSALKKEFFVPKSTKTIKVYEQKNAIEQSHNIGDYYVTNEKYLELQRFECKSGDFIMSCSGTIGKIYQLPSGAERGIINQALCKFTLNEAILPEVFLSFMQLSVSQLETKGSGIQNIGAVSYIKNILVPLAPMETQRNFASFVRRIDKLRFVIQQSLDETQKLFDSLMQEYFD